MKAWLHLLRRSSIWVWIHNRSRMPRYLRWFSMVILRFCCCLLEIHHHHSLQCLRTCESIIRIPVNIYWAIQNIEIWRKTEPNLYVSCPTFKYICSSWSQLEYYNLNCISTALHEKLTSSCAITYANFEYCSKSVFISYNLFMEKKTKCIPYRFFKCLPGTTLDCMSTQKYRRFAGTKWTVVISASNMLENSTTWIPYKLYDHVCKPARIVSVSQGITLRIITPSYL